MGMHFVACGVWWSSDKVPYRSHADISLQSPVKRYIATLLLSSSLPSILHSFSSSHSDEKMTHPKDFFLTARTASYTSYTSYTYITSYPLFISLFILSSFSLHSLFIFLFIFLFTFLFLSLF